MLSVDRDFSDPYAHVIFVVYSAIYIKYAPFETQKSDSLTNIATTLIKQVNI